MDGQTYVRVQARAASPTVLNAGGSGGSTVAFFTVRWDRSSGITDHGWPVGFPNVSGFSEEQINDEINTYYNGLPSEGRESFFDTYRGWRCIDF